MADEPITEQTNLRELLESGPEIVEAFRKLGLKCPDCVAVDRETVRHAALYHEKDLRGIVDALEEARRRRV